MRARAMQTTVIIQRSWLKLDMMIWKPLFSVPIKYLSSNQIPRFTKGGLGGPWKRAGIGGIWLHYDAEGHTSSRPNTMRFNHVPKMWLSTFSPSVPCHVWPSKTLLGHDAVLIGHIGGSCCAGVFTLHDLGLNGIRPAKNVSVPHWNVALKRCNMLSLQRQRKKPLQTIFVSIKRGDFRIFSSPNSQKCRSPCWSNCATGKVDLKYP